MENTLQVMDILRELGLTDKEARLYLELLRIGAQPASAIARTLGLARSTAQFLAETLASKGFVSKTRKNNVTAYVPEKPQNIKRVLDIQVDKYLESIQQQKYRLEMMAPLFDTVQNTTVRQPTFHFYEGEDNVLRSYRDFISGISSGEEICTYVRPAAIEHAMIRKDMQEFIQLRSKKNILCKTICTYGEDAVRMKITDKVENRQTLICNNILPDLYFAEILIHPQKVLTFASSDEGMISTIITDIHMAAMNRAVFDLAWKQAQQEDAKICRRQEVKQWMKKHRGLKQY